MGEFSFDLLVAAGAICLAIAVSAPNSSSSGELSDAIGTRLSWMSAVAAWKYSNHVQVEDRERESVVLAAAAKDAAALGLDPETAKGFFEAQIEAAKDIQRCWIDRWSSGDRFPDATLDLSTQIRPQLLRLGRIILEELEAEITRYGEISVTSQQAISVALDIECLGSDAKEAVLDGVRALRRAE